jgi:hypothetical protein
MNTDLIIDTPPVLTPIRAKKAVRDLLQADIVLTPVRKYGNQLQNPFVVRDVLLRCDDG